MKKKRLIVKITSSITITAILIYTITILTRSKAYAQFLESYKRLSKPEQQWVRRYPIAAFRTHNLADSAKKEAIRRIKDPDLDADIEGGMVDAFKHTFWMALTAQKIGAKKALLLGKAHEDANKIEFEKNPKRKGITQDSIASQMDMLNNIEGAYIGETYPDMPYQELIKIVKQAVVDGKCWKIKKKNVKTYLDSNNNIINIHDYDNKWAIPKVLIRSNKTTN